MLGGDSSNCQSCQAVRPGFGGDARGSRGRSSTRRGVSSLRLPGVRLPVVLDNFSLHLSTKNDVRVGEWARANNVELAYTPHSASWLNRIEAQRLR